MNIKVASFTVSEKSINTSEILTGFLNVFEIVAYPTLN